MMKKKFFAGLTAVVLSAAFLAGCGGNYDGDLGGEYTPMNPSYDADRPAGAITPSFPEIWDEGNAGADDAENVFQSSENTSYLSLDRNTASYSSMRSQIYANVGVYGDGIRIEELYNYFSYGYPAPEAGEGVKASVYLSDCPWNEESKLLTIGLKTEERTLQKARNNYVFLVDVSGSMSAYVNTESGRKTCLDLVKYGITTLVEGLGTQDSVSIVTYASGIQTVLEPTFAGERGKDAIKKAVNGLVASGATNGSGGLELAYENAEKYYSEEGNNRVIMLTDGDFNTGITNVDKLKELIAEKAQSGVYLSVLGVGMGSSYGIKQDKLMETLALNGNGNYAHIDTEREARKILCEELNGTLVTVLKDAKAGVTFDPRQVKSYRMLGYETKTISKDDFENSEKDTGEVGSNLCVSVVYEIKLAEGAEENAELAEVKVRFKHADTGENGEVTATAFNTLGDSEDIAFISCVAEFGLVIKNKNDIGTASLENVLARLGELSDYLGEDEYKQEFRTLVQRIKDKR